MNDITPCNMFCSIITGNEPDAVAWIRGNASHKELDGVVCFYRGPFGGVIVNAEIYGLPDSKTATGSDFYGMHIHESGNCTPHFDKTGGHYNPSNVSHPGHAGDLPPLLGNKGYAWSAFLTKRFTIEEILGKSVVIHAMRDDFTSQPSGNSGEKIGCGVIQ